MSALHLVRIPVDSAALAAFAIGEGVDDDDRGYALHLALRRRFGASAPQPFRLFERAAAAPHLLGYALDLPALLEAAELPALDERLDAVFPAPPAGRSMPASWRSGARYAFEVRVRPVVRYGSRARQARAAEGKRAAGERDAFLAALEKAGDVPPGALDRSAIYAQWLNDQVAGAARLDRAEVSGMQRILTYRSTHGRSGRPRTEGYDVLFTGTLTVEEPGAFTRLLHRGIDRHAAFGFGMLALAPPKPG